MGCPPSWLPSDAAARKRMLLTAMVNLLCGLYVGYSIGFPAVYMTYDQLSTDCGTFKTNSACTENPQAECVWVTSAGGIDNNSNMSSCHFADFVNCSRALSESECSALSSTSCAYANKKCTHVHGWTATQQGVFAASMIIGGTFGSFPIGRIMDKVGRKRSFMLLGCTSVLSCLLIHVACAVKNFAFLVIANILVGMPVGAIQVLAPMYVGEMAPAAWALQVGILIQVGITLGIFVMGIYGFAVQPSEDAMEDGSAPYENYFQATIAGLTVLSAVVGAIGIAVPESDHYIQALGSSRRPRDGSDLDDVLPTVAKAQEGMNLLAEPAPTDSLDGGKSDSIIQRSSYTDCPLMATNGSTSPFEAYANLPFAADETTCFGWRKTHVLCFVVSTALSACLALTGINSFIVYAPVIMQSAGMSSLVGNLVVDGWNFITTLVSLPLAFRCNTTQMFNAGAALVTATCVSSGVLMFPGVIEDETVRNWVLGAAVFLFIAAFEIGMATAYYVIAQATFPSDARSIGTGYTIAVQYLFNVFINFMYPVGLQAFSPSGGSNQQGMAVWLIIYGCVGILTTIVLVRYLGYAQYIASTM